QSVPVRIVANNEGSLYVVRGAQGWPLVPVAVDDLISPVQGQLGIGDEIDGTLPPPPEEFSPGTGTVDVLPDGSLYLVRVATAYPLVPDVISDADMPAITWGDPISGKLPPELWTGQAQSAPGGSLKGTINCDAGFLLGQGVVSYRCDDGEYQLN